MLVPMVLVQHCVRRRLDRVLRWSAISGNEPSRSHRRCRHSNRFRRSLRARALYGSRSIIDCALGAIRRDALPLVAVARRLTIASWRRSCQIDVEIQQDVRFWQHPQPAL